MLNGPQASTAAVIVRLTRTSRRLSPRQGNASKPGGLNCSHAIGSAKTEAHIRRKPYSKMLGCGSLSSFDALNAKGCSRLDSVIIGTSYSSGLLLAVHGDRIRWTNLRPHFRGQSCSLAEGITAVLPICSDRFQCSFRTRCENASRSHWGCSFPQ